MGDLTLVKTRAKARRSYRVYEAILTILNRLTVSDRERISLGYSRIESLDKSTLRKRLHELEHEIVGLRNHFEIKATDSQLLDVLEKTTIAPGRILKLMKNHLHRLVSRYEQAFPRFLILPEHAYVYIDAGQYRKFPGFVEWFSQEVSLYEDMCCLFNLLLQKRVHELEGSSGKAATKSINSLRRSTVVASYNFLESYMNGIGIDHVLLHYKTLDVTSIAFLTEWDMSKQRFKFTSLREKILQYPKIIKNLHHPPYQETNCQEIDFLMGDGKTIRDSIVHSSILTKGNTVGPEAITPLSHITQESVEKIVDSAISLIRKIETFIIGDERRIDWLITRDVSGHFPERVFD